MSALIYYVVFQFIMKVQVPNYILFLLLGLMPWNFLVGSLISGMESLVANASLLNKIPLPLHAIALSDTITAFINFLFTLPVIFAIAFITDAPLGASLILFPFFLLLMFLQCYSMGVVLGLYFVSFRDLRHALGILLQIWFYLTPIIYELKMVPEDLYFLIYFNPVSMIFTAIHDIFIYGTWPTQLQLLHSTGWTLFIFIASFYIVKHKQKTVIEFL
jgi:ABC-type polysaccharide/polyol phosphate export permease